MFGLEDKTLTRNVCLWRSLICDSHGQRQCCLYLPKQPLFKIFSRLELIVFINCHLMENCHLKTDTWLLWKTNLGRGCILPVAGALKYPKGCAWISSIHASRSTSADCQFAKKSHVSFTCVSETWQIGHRFCWVLGFV